MENEVLDEVVLDKSSLNEIEFAGFWVRVGASFIDALTYIPFILILTYNELNARNQIVNLIISMIILIYKPFMEYQFGGTLGKMAVKIKVVNLEYQDISLSQSIIRNSFVIVTQIVSIVPTIFLIFGIIEDISIVDILYVLNLVFSILGFISCIYVGFDLKKQAIHDKMAGTYNIYNKPTP